MGCPAAGSAQGKWWAWQNRWAVCRVLGPGPRQQVGGQGNAWSARARWAQSHANMRTARQVGSAALPWPALFCVGACGQQPADYPAIFHLSIPHRQFQAIRSPYRPPTEHADGCPANIAIVATLACRPIPQPARWKIERNQRSPRSTASSSGSKRSYREFPPNNMPSNWSLSGE